MRLRENNFVHTACMKMQLGSSLSSVSSHDAEMIGTQATTQPCTILIGLRPVCCGTHLGVLTPPLPARSHPIRAAISLRLGKHPSVLSPQEALNIGVICPSSIWLILILKRGAMKMARCLQSVPPPLRDSRCTRSAAIVPMPSSITVAGKIIQCDWKFE